MSSDMERCCKSFEDCVRRNVTFNHDPTELHPAKGLLYSWGVDLMGPFPSTDRGNVYIIITVEYLTCFIVAVPITNKEANTVAFFRRQHVRVYGSLDHVRVYGSLDHKAQPEILRVKEVKGLRCASPRGLLWLHH
jgi:hypothetical protein